MTDRFVKFLYVKEVEGVLLFLCLTQLKPIFVLGHLDAHVLWNSLRMQSKNKLMKEELKISHDAIVRSFLFFLMVNA